jgi:hypothetical protein
MVIREWLSTNWFELISTIGILASLWFTNASMRSATETQQIANLLTVAANHREIWKEFFRKAELARVLDPAANLLSHPVSQEEEIFVNLVLVHISNVYYATRDKLFIELEGLQRDISQFLALPIPKAVWNKWKPLQNDDIVAFIDGCLISQ